MKTRIFMLLTVAAMAGLLITACQKEQQTDGLDPLSAEQVYTPKASKLVQEINSFKQKITVVRENPHLKSGELMSKEEARWNIETLFNVTYGFPDDAYGRTVSDSTTVYLPVDASGNALLEDVVAVYDQIHDLVSQFYLSHNFEEKGFLLLQLQTGETSGNQMEIHMMAVTGARHEAPNNPPVAWIPFKDGDNWWFGELRGDCAWELDDTDASKEIQNYLNTKKPTPPPPPSGYRYIYVNDELIERFGDEYLDNDGNYLIYYIERPDGNFTFDDKCLDDVELNFHYFGQREVIYIRIPDEENKPDNWVFMNCVLTGQQKDNIYDIPCLHHDNKLTYAYRYLVPIIYIPDPIEILPPVD
jgi:hypothetical protein